MAGKDSIRALDQQVRTEVEELVLDWLEPRIRALRERAEALRRELPLPAQALPLIRDTLDPVHWRAWHEIRRQVPAGVSDRALKEGLDILETLGVVRTHRLSTGSRQYRLAVPPPAREERPPARPVGEQWLEPLSRYFRDHPEAIMTRREIGEQVLGRAASPLILSRSIRQACDAGILEPAGVRREGKGGRPAQCYRAGAALRKA
ncbi:protein of unknown function [Candidatus Hydrogenisulfobacillus filiaventi]|uniref:Uncharacterized protein n=1 Tax=Candidatus Hydrogenisulfobacillus filiaventi TaxID=2707344 RepID=A0A6F8ZCD8_9FIRM|nr:hypothetical protein [Bacillota bacterium]CAB1127528.1 protein of unknown function [Candidatus Hydrogenisulfobacillus filiaventi]